MLVFCSMSIGIARNDVQRSVRRLDGGEWPVPKAAVTGAKVAAKAAGQVEASNEPIHKTPTKVRRPARD